MMSTTVTVSIYCDICGKYEDFVTTRTKAKLRASRSAAKKSGWVYELSDEDESMQDICPLCVADANDNLK